MPQNEIIKVKIKLRKTYKKVLQCKGTISVEENHL